MVQYPFCMWQDISSIINNLKTTDLIVLESRLPGFQYTKEIMTRVLTSALIRATDQKHLIDGIYYSLKMQNKPLNLSKSEDTKLPTKKHLKREFSLHTATVLKKDTSSKPASPIISAALQIFHAHSTITSDYIMFRTEDIVEIIIEKLPQTYAIIQQLLGFSYKNHPSEIHRADIFPYCKYILLEDVGNFVTIDECIWNIKSSTKYTNVYYLTRNNFSELPF